MNVIKSERVVMCDVDDTLVLWDLSAHPDAERVIVTCFGYETILVPHEKNIKLLRKFAKLGYTIVVWSATGWEWANEVVRTLKIEDVVHSVMSKPRYYFDDIRAEEWIGQRIWRDPKSGEEESA